MKKSLRAVLVLAGLVGFGEIAVIENAMARGGGGSNFMNSPGYQRRLQESRGYVTNRSTSIATPPFAGPRAYKQRERRRR